MNEVELIEEKSDKPVKKPDYKWIVIVIFIINLLLLAYLVGLVLKNKDKLELDSLVYGCKQYDINSCYCTTNSGKQFYYNSSAIWVINENKQTQVKFNASELEKLLIK